jgi:hypothetical protein
MDAATTTFPRLRSAGLRGAKAVGNAQLMTVTTKTTNGVVVVKKATVTTKRKRGQNKIQEAQGTPLPSK